jgi:serine/threonine protein kinase
MLMDMEPMGIDAGRFFIKQLIKAVESLHDLNLAHRDLKPENMMLDSLLNIKLIDFGLANRLDESEEKIGDLGTFAGTP